MSDLNDQEREIEVAFEVARPKRSTRRSERFVYFEAGYRAALAAREDTERPDGKERLEAIAQTIYNAAGPSMVCSWSRVDEPSKMQWREIARSVIVVGDKSMRDTEQEHEHNKRRGHTGGGQAHMSCRCRDRYFSRT